MNTKSSRHGRWPVCTMVHNAYKSTTGTKPALIEVAWVLLMQAFRTVRSVMVAVAYILGRQLCTGVCSAEFVICQVCSSLIMSQQRVLTVSQAGTRHCRFKQEYDALLTGYAWLLQYALCLWWLLTLLGCVAGCGC